MLPELGHDDLVRTFVQMMRRKYLNVSANEMHLNFTPDELISRLDNSPLRLRLNFTPDELISRLDNSPLRLHLNFTPDKLISWLSFTITT